MTSYSDYPGHPLHGVPTEILDTARTALTKMNEDLKLDPDDVEPVADAIVSALVQAGYTIVKW